MYFLYSDKLMKCGGCLYVHYCSSDCQKEGKYYRLYEFVAFDASLFTLNLLYLLLYYRFAIFLNIYVCLFVFVVVATAWQDHKQECPHLKDLKNTTVPDAARIIAKIVRKLKNGGDMQRSYYTKHGFRKFRDLMSRK